MSTSLKSSLNTIVHATELGAQKNGRHRGPINDDLTWAYTWATPWFDPKASLPSINSGPELVEGRTGKLTIGKTTLCTRRSHRHDA